MSLQAHRVGGGHQAVALAMLFAVAVLSALAASGELGFSRSVTPGLIGHYERQFGGAVRNRLAGWKEFMIDSAGAGDPTGGTSGEAKHLRPVNNFFNRLPSSTDRALWGVDEYWATPAEALSVNGADCEDFAFAKYFALKELGMASVRLRMVYAKQANSSEAHMVLAYYPEPRAEPLILDNLDGRILPASQRPDLTPVYTFNDDELQYFQQGGSPVRLAPSAHRKWREYLEKLVRELAF